MMMQLSEPVKALNATLIGEDCPFSGVSIDSRTIHQGDLFIALVGERFDGHDYIAAAEAAGAAAIIISRPVDTSLPQLMVNDTRLALGLLAHYWRLRIDPTVIGITGSNGKTTVKEMTAAIFAVNASVLSTKGNLNNDYGVPLTLLALNPGHRYAVVEMGANHPGEIDYTSRLAQPDIALITNAGAAHLEGFGSIEGVARTKGELIESLSDRGVAILNHDDASLELWQSLSGQRRIITFGLSKEAEVHAEKIEYGRQKNGFNCTFTLIYKEQRQAVSMALAGNHNVCNALAAAAAAIAADIELGQIAEGLATLKPVSGRLQPMKGAQESLLINDSYNANPSSFSAAFNLLAALPGESWVVMGALGELGENSRALHGEVGHEARAKGITRLFAVGDEAAESVAAFGQGATLFNSQVELIEAVSQALQPDITVLIKGSRTQRMERVVEALALGDCPRTD